MAICSVVLRSLPPMNRAVLTDLDTAAAGCDMDVPLDGCLVVWQEGESYPQASRSGFPLDFGVLRCWRLDKDRCFHDSRNMESKTVVEALSALAQGSRLEVYRLLVQTG